MEDRHTEQVEEQNRKVKRSEKKKKKKKRITEARLQITAITPLLYMAVSSHLPTTTAAAATKHPSHRSRQHEKIHLKQKHEEEDEEQRRARRRKKKKMTMVHEEQQHLKISKPQSSWEQFKNLFTCRTIVTSQVHNPSSSAKLGSSCSSMCSIKDVVHCNTRVVHHHRSDHASSPEGSDPIGPRTSLLPPRASDAARNGHHQSSRGMQLRKLYGCYECHTISEPSRYPIPRTICSCPECGEVFTKSESLDHHRMIQHAVSELGQEDSGRNIVEIIFNSSWSKKEIIGNNKGGSVRPILCQIDRILKVHNTQRTISRFEDHRETVKSRSAFLLLLHNNSSIYTNVPNKKNPRCAVDGNELLRFHSTTLSCSLGADGSTSLCSGYSSSTCGVCTIIRHGFGRSRQESGKGVMTTASSGKAHDCYSPATTVMEDGGGKKRRAMLVCRVIAGRVRRSGDLVENVDEDGAGVGYDSVAGGGGGGGGNLEELFVTNPRAILPCFVVVYRTSTDI